MFDYNDFLNFLKNNKFAFYAYYASKVDATQVYVDFIRTQSFARYCKKWFNCHNIQIK